MKIWQAFALVALGMLLNQFYNWIGWKKFYEGRKDGREEHERSENQEHDTRKYQTTQRRIPH